MKLKVVDGREAIPEDAENMRRCFAIVDCPRITQSRLEVTLRFSSQGNEERPDTNLIAEFSPEDTQILQGKHPNISMLKSASVYLGQNYGYLVI